MSEVVINRTLSTEDMNDIVEVLLETFNNKVLYQMKTWTPQGDVWQKDLHGSVIFELRRILHERGKMDIRISDPIISEDEDSYSCMFRGWDEFTHGLPVFGIKHEKTINSKGNDKMSYKEMAVTKAQRNTIKLIVPQYIINRLKQLGEVTNEQADAPQQKKWTPPATFIKKEVKKEEPKIEVAEKVSSKDAQVEEKVEETVVPKPSAVTNGKKVEVTVEDREDKKVEEETTDETNQKQLAELKAKAISLVKGMTTKEIMPMAKKVSSNRTSSLTSLDASELGALIELLNNRVVETDETATEEEQKPAKSKKQSAKKKSSESPTESQKDEQVEEEQELIDDILGVLN